MASFIESIRTFFQERKGSRLILILLTALLLELVAALQYTYTRNLLIKEEERITRMELTMESEVVLHTLEEAELSMFENEWSVKESLAHPDSLFGAVRRMIESNSNVAGACIAVLPDYYPEKGRLFEPYAHREEGRILVDQIAGTDHDYTLGPYFRQALREEKEFCSDPYDYGEDPVQKLTTYTYPVRDRSGRLAAICGLDIDLTWLSDTLNVHPYYPSSFGFMLTRDGRLVAGPRAERVSPRTLEHVAGLVMDPTVDRTVRGRHRVSCIVFRDPVNGEEAYLDYRALPRDPRWIIAEVSYRDEVLAPVRRMMWRILLMALAGFVFLLVIIHASPGTGSGSGRRMLSRRASGANSGSPGASRRKCCRRLPWTGAT